MIYLCKCECEGHPFNCYNHPSNCGCSTEEIKMINEYPKSELHAEMLMEEEVENHNVQIKNVPIEIANDIWNAAIETAAKMAENRGLIGMKILAENIRKLKK